jgi:hypothetical protein
MAMFWRNRLDDTIRETNFASNYADVWFNAFGDFSTLRDDMLGIDWFLFYTATVLILLIMMNLFIGILSE